MISPLVRRRRLAVEIRHLREAEGLTGGGLAKRLGWKTSKVSRLETGFTSVSVTNAISIAEALGLNKKKWHELVQWANEAAERGWWADYGDHIGPRQRVNVDLEWGAATISEYNLWIPGLLQTADYTREREAAARMRGALPPNFDIDRAIDARMARQKMMRRPDEPAYLAIIDELAILRPAAPADVTREQLKHLVRMQEEDPQITIQILPIRAKIEDHWLPTSIFSCYTYDDPGDPTMVVVEGEGDDLVLSGDATRPYVNLLERLRRAALTPEDSTKLLRREIEYRQ